MLDYTAIDFETANAYRGSPCAVGLVRVRDGVAVEERHQLVRPPEQADFFHDFNVWLHGITADDVASSPRWSDFVPELVDFIGDDVVVAHNAGFDIGVIRYACAADNIAWPSLRFLCTLTLSRLAFKLPSYSLPFVCNECGFEVGEHHDPLADAQAVVGIVRALAQREGAADLEALARSLGTRIGYMQTGLFTGQVSTATGAGKLVAAEANADADPNGYLYGRVVVFTGKLMGMTRQMAWDEVVRAGGVPEKNTTQRTNVLVLGDFNPANLRPGATYSGKARKAFQLQDRGQDIELMTEGDFLRVIEGQDLSEIPPELLGG